MGKQDDFFKTQIRIPTDIYGQIKDCADESGRSINAEIIYLFQIALGEIKPPLSEDKMRELIRDELSKAGIKPD